MAFKNASTSSQCCPIELIIAVTAAARSSSCRSDASRVSGGSCSPAACGPTLPLPLLLLMMPSPSPPIEIDEKSRRRPWIEDDDSRSRDDGPRIDSLCASPPSPIRETEARRCALEWLSNDENPATPSASISATAAAAARRDAAAACVKPPSGSLISTRSMWRMRAGGASASALLVKVEEKLQRRGEVSCSKENQAATHTAPHI